MIHGFRTLAVRVALTTLLCLGTTLPAPAQEPTQAPEPALNEVQAPVQVQELDERPEMVIPEADFQAGYDTGVDAGQAPALDPAANPDANPADGPVPGWDPVLSGHDYTPETFLVINKLDQQFQLLSRQSPVRVVSSYPCTTGQRQGDKLIQGDLRTPEGVYFIGYQVPRDLDYELFGDLAFTLNYPNPVDLLKGKTGSGIWLHGRGKQLVPHDTRGCVALANVDIHNVAPVLASGTPVFIAKSISISQEPGPDATQAAVMADLVRQWADNWQNRSEAFFELYDHDAFSATTGESFSGFAEHKRSIFSSQPWIQVMVGNIHAAPGPDYWVTWFDQFYRTSNMTSTVGKRLYWMKDDAGHWRIVGREYVPTEQDMSATYLAAKTEDVRALVGRWSAAWEQADIKTYLSCYDESARQDSRVGVEAIGEYKARVWAERAPTAVRVDDVMVSLDPRGLRASFFQEYEDASGYRDQGFKTLILAPEGDGWRIVSEEWRAAS